VELAKHIAKISPFYAYKVYEALKAPELLKFYFKVLYNYGYYNYLEKYASIPKLYKLGAYSSYRLDHYTLVDKYFQNATKLLKNDYRIWLDSLLRKKNWEKYEFILSQIKDKYPKIYKEFLGWEYYYKGNWKESAKLLPYNIYKAIAFLNAGEYKKSIEYLQKEKLRSYTKALILAKDYLGLGQFEKVLEVLKNYETPQALYLKGLAYFGLGKYKEAIEVFKKLIETAPNYKPDAYLKLADAYYNLGDYKLAEKYYLEYIKKFPKGKQLNSAYLGLINVYIITKDKNLAELVYNIVIKNPHLAKEEVLIKLAKIFLKEGKIKKALHLLALIPNDTNNYIKAEKYLILAEIYKGNAPWYLEKVIKIGLPQQQSTAVLKLIDYYLKKGDKKKAEEILKKYETKITDMKKLIEIYIKLGKFYHLYNLLRELIAANPQYTEIAYNIAKKYHRIEFYQLAVYSPNPEIVMNSVYTLEKYYFKKKDIENGLKYAMILKIRKIKIEPTYSKAMFLAASELYKAGFLSDACNLIKEVNKKYLSSPEEKLKYEEIKTDCSKEK
jgi:TolA-binding protein